MAAPILLLPCRYVAPLALPAPPTHLRLTGPARRSEGTTLPRATSVRVETRPGAAAPPPAREPPPREPPAREPPAREPPPREPPAREPPPATSSRAPWDHDLPDPAPRERVLRPRPAPRPREPLAPRGAAEAAHDLVVVPQASTFRASEAGLKALVRFLQTSQLLAVRAQEDGPNGSLVLELAPDVFAHQLFYEGAAPSGAPVLIEGWLRSAPAPFATRIGPPRETCFAFELLGCRFPALSEGMKARLHQILYLRPQVVSAAHAPPLLKRQTPAPALQPIPRCDIREIDDA